MLEAPRDLLLQPLDRTGGINFEETSSKHKYTHSILLIRIFIARLHNMASIQPENYPGSDEALSEILAGFFEFVKTLQLAKEKGPAELDIQITAEAVVPAFVNSVDDHILPLTYRYKASIYSRVVENSQKMEDIRTSAIRPKQPVTFMTLPTELRLQIYEYIFEVDSTRHLTSIEYKVDSPYVSEIDRHFKCKIMCSCPRNKTGYLHKFARHHCAHPNVHIWTRTEALFRRVLHGQTPSEQKINTFLDALAPSYGLLRVNRSIYKEAVAILYGSRNLIFTGYDRRGVMGREDYQYYSIASFIPHLSQHSRSLLRELTIEIGYGSDHIALFGYRRARADFCWLVLNELKGLQRLNVQAGRPDSSVVRCLSHQSVRKKERNSEDVYLYSPKYIPTSSKTYWQVDGADPLAPFAILLGNPDLQFSITVKPYQRKLKLHGSIDHIEGNTLNLRGPYLSSVHVNEFFAQIKAKRRARAAQKAAGEGGMKYLGNFGEFLPSAQDGVE